MVTTSVTLCGRELENPIIPASGTFGYGYEFAELYDINCLGTFSFKGTTLHPRTGNAQPRIAEAPGGMLNAVGLQNPGVDAVIAEELPKLQRVFQKPVMANVSGFSIEEYVEVCRRLDACGQVGWLEVNISCPNVHGGGMSFGTDPKAAAAVTRAVKDAVQKPVIVKLSPNVTSIADIAKACEDAGADAVSLINTVLGMRIDLRGKKPLLANKTGGMSRWRCGWSGRSMRPSASPSSAWAASGRRRTCSSSCSPARRRSRSARPIWSTPLPAAIW